MRKEKIISPIGDIKFRVLRKPWFWILLVVIAFVVFYHCGGKLLIVRWTLHLPVPTWLKRVLWGW